MSALKCKTDIPLYHLLARFNHVQKDSPNWHTIDPVEGEITGIPILRGTLVASNGSLSLLCRGGKLVLVHNTSFIEDKVQPTRVAKPRTTRVVRTINLAALQARYADV